MSLSTLTYISVALGVLVTIGGILWGGIKMISAVTSFAETVKQLANTVKRIDSTNSVMYEKIFKLLHQHDLIEENHETRITALEEAVKEIKRKE